MGKTIAEGITKRGLKVLLLTGMIWFVSGAEIQAQERSPLQLAAGAPAGHRINTSGKKNPVTFEHVDALAMDAEEQTLFLGTHTGLFRSNDGGRTWKKVSVSAKQPSLEVVAVAPDQKQPSTIYIATREAGVFTSADGGTNWSQINNGLGGLDVHGLAIDPNDGKLHVVIRNKGQEIYRSTNGGGKWSRVNGGPGPEIQFLISVNIPTGMGGIFLYAGTATGLQRSPDCF